MFDYPNDYLLLLESDESDTADSVSLSSDSIDDNNYIQEKLVLPPEFDENDSRWTLKHREPAQGLVELMEHSGVYVDADKLAECKKSWLMTHCTLARLLLTEIFTTTALRICSWSTANTDAPNTEDIEARPALDEHATKTIVKFVEEYGQLRNWEFEDFQSTLDCFRQILIEMRRPQHSSRTSYSPESELKILGCTSKPESDTTCTTKAKCIFCVRKKWRDLGFDRFKEYYYRAGKILTPEYGESRCKCPYF